MRQKAAILIAATTALFLAIVILFEYPENRALEGAVTVPSSDNRQSTPSSKEHTDLALNADEAIPGFSFAGLAVLLDEAGVGPITHENISAVESGRRYFLVRHFDQDGTTYAVIDLQSRKVNSIVPVGSYLLRTKDDAFVFIEVDRVKIYRRDWPMVQKVDESQLSGDETYRRTMAREVSPNVSIEPDGAIKLAVYELPLIPDEEDDMPVPKPSRTVRLSLPIEAQLSTATNWDPPIQ